MHARMAEIIIYLGGQLFFCRHKGAVSVVCTMHDMSVSTCKAVCLMCE